MRFPRIRFTLRSAFAVSTVCAVFLGLLKSALDRYESEWSEEQAALSRIPWPAHDPVIERNVPIILRPFLTQRKLTTFDRVVGLDMGGDTSDKYVKNLRSFTRLKQLSLMDYRCTDQSMGTVSSLKGLEKLDLSVTNVTDAGVRELDCLENLRDLNLSETRISGKSLRILGTIKTLGTLRLVGTKVRDHDLAPLANLRDLHVLDVAQTDITDAAVPYLLQCSHLECLRVYETHLSAGAVFALGEMPSLKRLVVSRRTFTNDEIKTLEKRIVRPILVWQ